MITSFFMWLKASKSFEFVENSFKFQLNEALNFLDPYKILLSPI